MPRCLMAKKFKAYAWPDRGSGVGGGGGNSGRNASPAPQPPLRRRMKK
nr:unnamed protein product [Callosobruchus analis]